MSLEVAIDSHILLGERQKNGELHHFVVQAQKKEQVICKQCQIRRFPSLKNILDKNIKNRDKNQSISEGLGAWPGWGLVLCRGIVAALTGPPNALVVWV